MYSWEIQKLMEARNWLLSNEEYFKLFETSPQINHVQYYPDGDYFNIKTDDRYDFKFKVYKKTKNNP